MKRKCSECGNIGHNLRTCTFKTTTGTHTIRLFGMQLNPTSSSSSSSFRCSYSPSSTSSPTSSVGENNASDGLIGHTQNRKKGVAWTKEEHRQFLLGLENLGKGRWKGIARDFVATRTATQIASHAQKYFLRQTSFTKGKRRPSLFDMQTSEHNNNFCGLTLHTTKLDPFASKYSNFQPDLDLDPFASKYSNFQPDLDLKLASDSALVLPIRRLLHLNSSLFIPSVALSDV